MVPDIKAIFLDVGNTPGILVKDKLHQARAKQQIMPLDLEVLPAR